MQLEASYRFYSAYHSNPINKWIHVVTVPIIFVASIRLLHLFIPKLLIIVITGGLGGSYGLMEFKAGLSLSPVIGLLTFWALQGMSVSTAVILWVLGWVMQFIGHGVFERRRPALLDGLLQALHAALFFVWLELLFSLGFRKDLLKKLH